MNCKYCVEYIIILRRGYPLKLQFRLQYAQRRAWMLASKNRRGEVVCLRRKRCELIEASKYRCLCSLLPASAGELAQVWLDQRVLRTICSFLQLWRGALQTLPPRGRCGALTTAVRTAAAQRRTPSSCQPYRACMKCKLEAFLFF